MRPDKVRDVLDSYINFLLDIGAKPIRNEELDALVDVSIAKHHVLWMCIEAKVLVDQGRLEKSMRWLGFIQGALWALRLKTVEDMKADNKPMSDVDVIGG